VEATLEAASGGILEVYAGDELIAARSGGFLKKLLGGGWPDPDAVVEALRTRIGAA
jgi:hypothetical protein